VCTSKTKWCKTTFKCYPIASKTNRNQHRGSLWVERHPRATFSQEKKWEKGKMREMSWGRKKFEKTITDWDRGTSAVERGEVQCVAAWVAVHSGG
jgi:hypothetical protein